MPNTKSSVIAAVCQAVTEGSLETASSTLQRDYPSRHSQSQNAARSRRIDSCVRARWLCRQVLRRRLVFPPVLRLVSAALPGEFPFTPTGKTDVTHPAYWEIGATVDHLFPCRRAAWISRATGSHVDGSQQRQDELDS